MKFGLFLALLVLLASTNVFGQQGGTTKIRQNRRNQVKTDEVEPDQEQSDHTGVDSDHVMTGGRHENQPVKTTDFEQAENKSRAVTREDTTPITDTHEEINSGVEDLHRKPTHRDDVREKFPTKTGRFDHDAEDTDGTHVNVNAKLGGQRSSLKTEDHDTVPEKVTVSEEGTNIKTEDHDAVPEKVTVSEEGTNLTTEDHDIVPEDATVSVEGTDLTTEDHDIVPEDVKPGMNVTDRTPSMPIKEPHPDQEQVEGEPMGVDGIKDKVPVSEVCIKTFSFRYTFLNFRLLHYLKIAFMLVVTLFLSNIIQHLLIQFNMILMVHV